MRLQQLPLLLLLLGVSPILLAQNIQQELGHISGNFQTDVQYYFNDPAIDSTGSSFPDERLLANGFLNLTYTRGNFIAGVRYENYQNNRLGLPEGFEGEGITFRYLRFIKDRLEVTAGNFYEQFGTGMIFRSFREPGLGVANAMDGLRIAYEPTDGLILKGIIGRQRLYFGKGEGVVRGADVDWNLSHSLGWKGRTNLIIGSSIVSRFEEARDPILNLPENVASGGFRANLIAGSFNFYGEYGYKANDPNGDNNYIYKPGHAFYATASYAKNNLGIIAGIKRYDNFLFRSQREASFTELLINYLPPLAELHTYALPALYSYNIQPNGEMGYQLEASYKFKRKSFLGGKYGTLLNVNFSNTYSLDKEYIFRTDSITGNPTQAGTDGYTADLLTPGETTYFQDLNIEVKSKLDRKSTLTATYFNFLYNFSVLNDGAADVNLPAEPKVAHVNAVVLEWLYKVKSRHSLRSEFQWLGTTKDFPEDRGDWALLLLEYSIAPKWFFAVQDAWNYGNPIEDNQLHYPIVSAGYTHNTTKFQLTYGRQQSGVFCVGGICRVVPASNGFTLTVTSNF